MTTSPRTVKKSEGQARSAARPYRRPHVYLLGSLEQVQGSWTYVTYKDAWGRYYYRVYR